MDGRKRRLALIALMTVVTLLVSMGAPDPNALYAAVPVLPPQPTGDSVPGYGHDAPADAPHRSRSLVTPQATNPTVTYELESKEPKVKLKVTSGDDIGQYLFRDHSPLSFSIPLKGFKAAQDHPASVTLMVYDVDEAGTPDACGPEIDKVSVNGFTLGNLSGSNNAETTFTRKLPASAMNGDQLDFQIAIDTFGGTPPPPDPSPYCWAVEVDAVEITIPFNIGQIQDSTEQSHTILRGNSEEKIENPLFEADFDEAGSIVVSKPEDPLAASIIGGARFTYKYQIKNWPTAAKPKWTPRVQYEYEVVGSDIGNVSGQRSGWDGDFPVMVPQRIDKYTLKVTLKIYNADRLLRTEVRNHTLYALWAPPKPVDAPQVGAKSATPKTDWLDLAMRLAHQPDNDIDLVSNLNTELHKNPLGWTYGLVCTPAIPLISGTTLIGQCSGVRDVWRLLAGILGIQTVPVTYKPAEAESPFLTRSEAAAFDGNAAANAKPFGLGGADRWVFDVHYFGSKYDRYYDPTFGLEGPYANRLQNVFCIVSPIISPGGNRTCRSLTSGQPVAQVRRTTESNAAGWLIWRYKLGASLNAVTGALAPTAAGSFIGTPSERGDDTDVNGLFDRLRVDATLRVTKAGRFSLLPSLLKANGTSIATGSLDPAPNLEQPTTSTTLTAGVHTVSIYFSGRDIRAANVAGPYKVQLGLFDEAGATLGTATVTTKSYSHLRFQGPVFGLGQVSDKAAPTRPGATLLRVTAQVTMLAAGDLTVQGELYQGTTSLATIQQTTHLAAGARQLTLDFSGTAIAASRVNGPYTVVFAVSDHSYTASARHTTATYRYTDFQRSAAYLTGTIHDAGQGAGGYTSLNVVAQIAGLIKGTYTLDGILQDSAGGFIAAADAQVVLGATPVNATLPFAGLAIARHGKNGPYRVVLILNSASGQKLMRLLYTTRPYAASAFVQPGASFSATRTDRGLDTDGDGFFNVLRINVGVVAKTAGLYTVGGSLLDAEGSFITADQRQITLNAGAQTISLDLDGRAIRRHGRDGRYQLVALELQRADGVTVARVATPYTTRAYASSGFQSPTGVITGMFVERGEDTNGDGVFERLIIGVQVAVTTSDVYVVSARLVDSAGQEIDWSASGKSLGSGIHLLGLHFDGRSIYAHGIDGPFYLKDLSVYSSREYFSVLDAYTTASYSWRTFAPSGSVRGTVQAGGLPVPNAAVFIAGTDNQSTDRSGAFTLVANTKGNYTVGIRADARFGAWQIWVNGSHVADGNSAKIPVQVGQVTRVDFVSGTAPSLGLSASGLAFSQRAVGSSSPAQSVILSSRSTVPVTLSDISLAGADADDFTETTTCQTDIAPGTSCTISVTFTPVAPGIRSATLVIADNAPGGPHRIELVGIGLGGKMVSVYLPLTVR